MGRQLFFGSVYLIKAAMARLKKQRRPRRRYDELIRKRIQLPSGQLAVAICPEDRLSDRESQFHIVDRDVDG